MSSSFQTTPAKSSRVTKPARRKSNNPLLRRSSSSAFTTSPRRKPSTESTKVGGGSDERIFDEPLDDTGLVASLATDLELRDVPQFIQNVKARMFTPFPERASGMNAQRTAEVLNFRINLPPVASVAHVHALSKSPTVTEREMAELTRAGVIRKVVIPGRGVGNAAVGEGLVLVSEWEKLVRSHPDLDDAMKGNFCHAVLPHFSISRRMQRSIFHCCTHNRLQPPYRLRSSAKKKYQYSVALDF